MPTETHRRGELRWRGVVKMDGKIQASKWFGSGPKEQRKAILWEEETRKAILAKQQTPMALLEPLQWATEYMSDVKRRFAGKTYDEKRTAFVRFLRFAKGKGMEDITPSLALAYLQEQHDKRSAHGANRDRKNLATAWKWGCSFLDGFPTGRNPFLAVPRFAEDAKGRYIPPVEDFEKVLALATGQDRVMLMTFLHTAARRGEVFRLTWDDVDFTGNRLRLTTRKTASGSMRGDWLPMTNELRASLLGWWEARPYKQAKHVFTCLDDSPSPNHNPGGQFLHRQHFMPRMCERAGVKPFGFHAIRHLAAAMMARAGVDLVTIQAILRHEKPTTTDRYLKSMGNQLDAMRKAVETFSTRGPAKVIPFARKEETPEAGTSRVSGYPSGISAGHN